MVPLKKCVTMYVSYNDLYEIICEAYIVICRNSNILKQQ